VGAIKEINGAKEEGSILSPKNNEILRFTQNDNGAKQTVLLEAFTLSQYILPFWAALNFQFSR